MQWNESLTTHSKGVLTEDIAAKYLCQQLLIELARNFHSRQGEIDLIMRDQHTLVFIEVKYRKNVNFGSAVATVTAKKQHKIKKCAAFYLQQNGFNEYNTPCRFDVIGIEGELNHPQITWLKNAF